MQFLKNLLPILVLIKKVLKPNDLIIKEIMLFQNHHPDSIYIEIQDDGMGPLYHPGDFVAGIKKKGRHINELVKNNCIIETTNGERMLRYLKQSEKKNKYLLVCINSDTSVKVPVLYDIEIKSAAYIARHYKTIKQVD